MCSFNCVGTKQTLMRSIKMSLDGICVDLAEGLETLILPLTSAGRGSIFRWGTGGQG